MQNAHPTVPVVSPHSASGDDGCVAAATKSNTDYERDIQEALASLQLPHMPKQEALHVASDDHPKQQQQQQQLLPTITVLVCADIDLQSTSALAEYTLQAQKKTSFDAATIDLILVAGSFTHDDDGDRNNDLARYYSRGIQQRRRQKKQQQQEQQAAATEENQSKRHPSRLLALSYNNPFLRSREECAALEGVMTAALSQLESIVCRVVYCPGYSDPLTTLTSNNNNNNNNKRLTPNSRNIHRNWLPLVPGLGCAGLFYLDGMEQLLMTTNTTSPAAAAAADAYVHQVEDDDDDSDASDEPDRMAILSEQLSKLQQSSLGYCSTLTKLLELAPKPENPATLQTGAHKCQTILVTHYVDAASSQSLLLQQDHDDDEDESSLLFRDDEDVDDQEDNNNFDDDKDDNDVSESSRSSNHQTTQLPWPANDHAAFLESRVAQQHLCLEIASGSAKHHPPAWIPTANGRSSSAATSSEHPRPSNIENDDTALPTTKGPVLMPGSLRERGEFSILELALVEQNDDDDDDDDNQGRRFEWQVQKVDFHRLNNYYCS